MISKIKLVLIALAIASATGSLLYVKNLKSKLEYYKAESERHDNNYKFYSNKSNEQGKLINALQLTSEQLEQSRDSALIELNKFKKKYRQGKDKPGDTYIGAGGTIYVTDTITIDNSTGFDLDTTFVFNDKTKSRIVIDSTSVANTLDIKVGLNMAIQPRMKYTNEYKSFLRRLLRFDFKKSMAVEYVYEFTNDAIKPDEIRVVIIE